MALAARLVFCASSNITQKGMKVFFRAVVDLLDVCKDLVSLMFGDGGPAVDMWGV